METFSCHGDDFPREKDDVSPAEEKKKKKEARCSRLEREKKICNDRKERRKRTDADLKEDTKDLVVLSGSFLVYRADLDSPSFFTRRSAV